VSALLGGALQTALPVLWTLASGDTAKDIAEGEKLLAEAPPGVQTENRRA
jgi:muconate cycloisomerase